MPSSALATTLAEASSLAGHDHRQLAALESQVSALRIQNAKLMEELGRTGRQYDSKGKISVLTELNDKLELDLDLALKELALTKRKADAANTELAKIMSCNITLEAEIANFRQTATQNEHRLEQKRNWAEKRLQEEEIAMRDLKEKVANMDAQLTKEKEMHQRTKDTYAHDFQQQESLMRTMQETHRHRIAELEETVRIAAKRARNPAGAQAAEVFQQFDANGDGIMDQEEFAAAFATFNGPPKTQHRPFPAPGSREGRFDYQCH